MSRLIDADLVLDKMRNTFDMQDLYLPIHFKELIIDDLPTVKAIPLDRVEQIRAEMAEKENKLGFDSVSDVALKTAYIEVLKNIDKALKEQDE